MIAEKSVPLWKLAKTVRSKNAGSFHLTFDIIFEDFETYDRVRRSGVISPQTVASLYGIERLDKIRFFEYDPGNAFKITIDRPFSSGAVGDTDVYGCQQYSPLLDIQVPASTASR